MIRAPFGHPLAGPQVERHAGPAPVVDEALEGDERLGLGVVRHPFDVAVADVLPADDVGGLDRAHRAEDLVLLLADRQRLERGRRLHRGERQHLEQVGHDHVAVGAGALVERRPLGQTEILGNVDLDVVDVVAVPDRLEQAVGEPEREDVLRCLLAEEVVDPEDLVLVEDLVELGVQLLCALQVGPERLLHDDPAPLDQSGLLELVDHRERCLGGHREVVEALELTEALALGLLDGAAQTLGAGLAGRPVEELGELPPPLGVAVVAAELDDRLVCELEERLAVVLVEGGADDPEVAHQARLEEVEHAGQELAARQVAGRTEEDDGRGLERHATSLPLSARKEKKAQREERRSPENELRATQSPGTAIAKASARAGDPGWDGFMMRTTLTWTAVLGLALAAPASAAPVWTAPRAVSGPGSVGRGPGRGLEPERRGGRRVGAGHCVRPADRGGRALDRRYVGRASCTVAAAGLRRLRPAGGHGRTRRRGRCVAGPGPDHGVAPPGGRPLVERDPGVRPRGRDALPPGGDEPPGHDVRRLGARDRTPRAGPGRPEAGRRRLVDGSDPVGHDR